MVTFVRVYFVCMLAFAIVLVAPRANAKPPVFKTIKLEERLESRLRTPEQLREEKEKDVEKPRRELLRPEQATRRKKNIQTETLVKELTCPVGTTKVCEGSGLSQLSGDQRACSCRESKFVAKELVCELTPLDKPAIDLADSSCLEKLIDRCNDANERQFAKLSTSKTTDSANNENLLCVNEQIAVWTNGDAKDILLSSDCAPSRKLAKDLVCDLADENLLHTPVSLIVEDDVDINDEVSITSFSLNPNKPDTWFSWKGSSKAPLLVYNPHKETTVRDATQLFGNWSFGGKSYAAINNEDEQARKEPLWKHGFDALGTLDFDQDGLLRGEELESIYLWYDRNRDGKTQSGELKSIIEEGFVTLFYNPDRVDPITNDIYVTRGYERVVDGQQITGPSVDWYGAESESKLEAVAKLAAKGTLPGTLPGIEFEPRAGDTTPLTKDSPTKEATNNNAYRAEPKESETEVLAKNDTPPRESAYARKLKQLAKEKADEEILRLEKESLEKVKLKIKEEEEARKSIEQAITKNQSETPDTTKTRELSEAENSDAPSENSEPSGDNSNEPEQGDATVLAKLAPQKTSATAPAKLEKDSEMSEGETQGPRPSEEAEKQALVVPEPPSVDGIWQWQLDDEKKKTGSYGVLNFKGQGLVFTGSSYVEVAFKRNSENIKSQLFVAPLSGSISIEEDGTTELSFKTISENAVTTSTAKLSPDGKKLQGSSVTEFRNSGARDGTTSIRYTWSAIRKVQ